MYCGMDSIHAGNRINTTTGTAIQESSCSFVFPASGISYRRSRPNALTADYLQWLLSNMNVSDKNRQTIFQGQACPQYDWCFDNHSSVLGNVASNSPQTKQVKPVSMPYSWSVLDMTSTQLRANLLKHWGLNRTIDIIHTKLNNTFCWTKMVILWLRFYSSWFLKARLTVHPYWLNWLFATEKAKCYYPNQCMNRIKASAHSSQLRITR